MTWEELDDWIVRECAVLRVDIWFSVMEIEEKLHERLRLLS